MDKIWDRKSYKVGGHWPLWRGWKYGRPRKPDKGRTLEKHKKKLCDWSMIPCKLDIARQQLCYIVMCVQWLTKHWTRFYEHLQEISHDVKHCPQWHETNIETNTVKVCLCIVSTDIINLLVFHTIVLHSHSMHSDAFCSLALM